MSYVTSLKYLYGLQKYGIKFGLNQTSNLLKALGNPHKGEKYIHIAGSNGKGSVAVMLESVLMRSGLKVGFYLSPHLVQFTERFRINGKEISRQAVSKLIKELKGIIRPEDPPTFFEVTTAMALAYFKREGADLSIMEVGMGGRLDATNVIRPLVSVITNISMEHQSFLGSRLMDIAGEKAGIIKEGVDLVTAAKQPKVYRLFESICREKEAPFRRVGQDFRYRSRGKKLDYYGMNHRYKNLEIGLKGRFQNRNAALALAVLEILREKKIDISHRNIEDGLRETVWPGRMQRVSERPEIILDGAHNPGAVKELAHAIRGQDRKGRLILVIGVMEDKEIGRILENIVPVADYVIYTRPVYYRAADPGILERAASPFGRPGRSIATIPEALDRAKDMAQAEDTILVCGSLFTVGEALIYFYPEKYKPDPI